MSTGPPSRRYAALRGSGSAGSHAAANATTHIMGVLLGGCALRRGAYCGRKWAGGWLGKFGVKFRDSLTPTIGSLLAC